MNEDSKAKAMAYLNYYAEQPMRCSKCNRVSAFVDNGKCGSPICHGLAPKINK